MQSVQTFTPTPNAGFNPLRSLRIALPDSPNDEQSAYAARFVDLGSDHPLPAPAKPSTTKLIPCKCGMWTPSDFTGLFVVSPVTGRAVTIPDHAVDQLPPRVRARIVKAGRCGVAMFTPHELHEIYRLWNTPAPAVQATSGRTTSRKSSGFGGRWSRR